MVDFESDDGNNLLDGGRSNSREYPYNQP